MFFTDIRNKISNLQSLVDTIVKECRYNDTAITDVVLHVQKLQQDHDHLTEILPSLVAAEVEKRLLTIEQERQAKLGSKNPYFEVISEVDVEDGNKARFELDWNPAFISELKSKGYTGATEQEYVYKWLRVIADQVEKGSVA